MGARVFFTENSCRGKGDRQCHIIGQSMDLMSDQTRRAIEEFQGADFDLEMRTALASLDERTKDLEVERAHTESLQRQVVQLEQLLTLQNDTEAMVGVSDGFQRMMDEVVRVAATDAIVLVLGETGTGKDLVAREIHRRSGRRNCPFVTLNCGALSSGLVESEVFGHEKGAFTGASQRKLGRFELANNGTLFLDEIGELPLDTQVKFLHLLQRGEFERVGGNQTHKVDVRIVAATNRNLEKLVSQGQFRADLFYRLNIFPVYVPPLSERVVDIIPLVNHFVQKSCIQFGRKIKALNRESLRHLQGYDWPGNIPELEHVIERAVLLAADQYLTPDLSGPEAQPVSRAAFAGASKDLVPLDALERTDLQRVSQSTGGMVERTIGPPHNFHVEAATFTHSLYKP